MKSIGTISICLIACAAPAEPASSPELGRRAGDPLLGQQLGALDGGPRTIPYGGYVDFDGEPVNAGSVAFNFVLFPCATPGTGAGGCDALWVAKGAWTNTTTWTNGWPTGASDSIALPIFAGRFSVELGAAGQTPLPDIVFEAGHEVLYLGTRIEGRPLGGLQKVVPSARSRVTERAYSAAVADMVGDLTPEEIATRRSWVTSGELAPNGSLELLTFGDATNAEVFLWERRAATWFAIDPDVSFVDDPALEVYYPFDEEASAPTAQDASGHGRHLTLSRNATLGHEGAFGRSIDFGGASETTGGRAQASGMGMSLGARFTVMYWIRPTHILNHQYIYSLGSTDTGNELHHLLPYAPGCGGRVYMCIQSGCTPTCSAARPRTGTWLHFAATYDLDQRVVRTYSNGLLETTHNPGDSAALPVLNTLIIGTFTNTADLTGRVDEFAVFGRALSPAEIHDIYQNGLGAERYGIERHADGRVIVTNRTGATQTIRALVVK